ncbi:MAG: hypothetical protein PWQ37_1242 [Candidatus Petromonas sp.]|nr:hypothetical protein [Candidatus Petromonas sp.]
MLKILKKKKVYIFALGISVLITYPYISKALSAEPGSESDPIVTQSYVEMRNEQLKYYIDENLKKINTSIETLNKEIENLNDSAVKDQTKDDNQAAGASVYEVVTVPANKKLILGASSELILRAGKATVIDSKLGGLADVTAGADLKYGENVPQNHLLIVPRNDGRGAAAVTESIFMVKGGYTIQ